MKKEDLNQDPEDISPGMAPPAAQTALTRFGLMILGIVGLCLVVCSLGGEADPPNSEPGASPILPAP